MRVNINVGLYAVLGLSYSLATYASGANLALEEVIVTAQKRLEAIQDVPITMQAVTGDELDMFGAIGVADVQNKVPNLNITSGSFTPFGGAIRLRGVGSEGLEPSIEASVGFFVDGVYQSRSGLGMSDLIDVERVEILYGPQGTLYGKNTNAGVISVTTKRPAAEFEASLEATVGNYNARQLKAIVSGPVTDTLAYRAALSRRKRDGYIDNHFDGSELNDADDTVFRGQLLWTPTDELEILLIATNIERDTNCCAADVQFGAAHQGAAAALGIDLGKNDWQDYEVIDPLGTGFSQETDALSLHVEYDMDWAVLSSTTAWDQYEWDTFFDLDRTELGIVSITDQHDAESISQEFRLVGSSDNTDWVAGLFYYDNELLRGKNNAWPTLGDHIAGLDPLVGSQFCPAMGLPMGCLVSAPGDAGIMEHEFYQTSYSAFGQLTWYINEDWSFTNGLRYSSEDKETELNFRPTASLANPGAMPPTFSLIHLLIPPVAEDLDRSDEQVTFMTNLQRIFSDDFNVYFTIATGFKAGGFNGAAGMDDDRGYDPEESTNYELGFKLSLLDGRGKFNGALFRTEFDDFQTLAFSQSTNSFFVDNAGEMLTQGVDLEFAYRVTENLTLEAAVTYLDTEFSSFENADCHFGRSPDNTTLGTCDRSGEPLDFTPEWSSTTSLTYVQPFRSGEFYGYLNWVYKGDHTTQTDGNPDSEQSYDLWNGRVGYRDDLWDVSLWGKNITDEVYFTQIEDTAFLPGTYQAFLGEPRAYGITLRRYFGDN